jgi:anti-sigma factor RsiW
VDCTQVQGQLHRYLDKELDSASILAVDQHLASCAACQKAFGVHSVLQGAIRKHLRYHTAPDSLADWVRAGIGGNGDRARTARRPAWRSLQIPGWLRPGAAAAASANWLQLGTAVAATALISWVAAVQYTTPGEDEATAEQVVSGHARAMVTSRLTDVVSSDQHAVKPWLSSKLDFSLPVTDLATAGFPLVGGRVDYLGGRTVAALVYRHRDHVIEVFVWPDRKGGRGRHRGLRPGLRGRGLMTATTSAETTKAPT